MDYPAMLTSWREVEKRPPQRDTVRESFRTVVKEPEDYAEDMAALDYIESRISAMVAEGVISGIESLRMTREIPALRKRLKATRKVFRVRNKAHAEEEDV